MGNRAGSSPVTRTISSVHDGSSLWTLLFVEMKNEILRVNNENSICSGGPDPDAVFDYVLELDQYDTKNVFIKSFCTKNLAVDLT